MHEMTASKARYEFADRHEAAVGHEPTRIVRRRGGAAILVSQEDFEAMLRGFDFHPEVFFERAAVSIWIPELAIWGRGPTFEDARADLLDEIDQVLALLGVDAAMRNAPETVRRMPWFYRLAETQGDDRRLALLFAESEAPVTA